MVILINSYTIFVERHHELLNAKVRSFWRKFDTRKEGKDTPEEMPMYVSSFNA